MQDYQIKMSLSYIARVSSMRSPSAPGGPEHPAFLISELGQKKKLLKLPKDFSLSVNHFQRPCTVLAVPKILPLSPTTM
jgi:hypothetical protein